jgi:hypothetical protein
MAVFSRCPRCRARLPARNFSVSDFACQISWRAVLRDQGGSDDVPSRHFGRDLCLVCVGILYGHGVGARLLGHGLDSWFRGVAPTLASSRSAARTAHDPVEPQSRCQDRGELYVNLCSGKLDRKARGCEVLSARRHQHQRASGPGGQGRRGSRWRVIRSPFPAHRPGRAFCFEITLRKRQMARPQNGWRSVFLGA